MHWRNQRSSQTKKDIPAEKENKPEIKSDNKKIEVKADKSKEKKVKKLN